MISIELAAKLRNFARYAGAYTPDIHKRARDVLIVVRNPGRAPEFSGVPDRKQIPMAVHGNTDFDCVHNATVLRCPCDKKTSGSQRNGECGSLPRASCADLITNGKQIRAEFGARYAGGALDRQNKLGGHAFLGSIEPIPDERLPRADQLGQAFLAAGNITGTFESIN